MFRPQVAKTFGITCTGYRRAILSGIQLRQRRRGRTKSASSFGNRQIEGHRAAAELVEAEMSVKGERNVVLCIDNQGVDRRFCSHSACDCVHNQRRSEPLSLKSPIDGEPPNETGRKCGIIRKSLCVLRRHVA